MPSTDLYKGHPSSDAAPGRNIRVAVDRSRHGRSRKSRVRVTSSGVRDACSGQRVPRACQPTRVETAPDCAASVHALFNRTVCCKCDRQPVEGSSRRPIAVRGALHEFDTEAVIQVSGDADIHRSRHRTPSRSCLPEREGEFDPLVLDALNTLQPVPRK